MDERVDEHRPDVHDVHPKLQFVDFASNLSQLGMYFVAGNFNPKTTSQESRL
jgi:hypothetical protein